MSLIYQEYIMSRSYHAYIVCVAGVWSQQAFREAPTDTSINQGDTVKLTCEVDNIAGQLQWTKDGFALGTCAA
jgi:hypothetical protein